MTRRCCPICTTEFTPNPRQPAHTYCTNRCRRTAYDRRARSTVPDGVPDAVDDGDTAPEQVQRTQPGSRPDASSDAVGGVGDGVADEVHDTGHCPHCGQPIALVTLLLAPTAAHVTVPEPPTTHQRRHGRT
jgi:endogenous inhibitor of DNA gyrase (YacG/DUF329 family)